MRLAPLYRQDRDRAIQESLQQEKEKIVLNLLRTGVNIEQIANSIDLPLDRVLELQQQLENENRED